jgi:tetratricopeptide (TPR) repeat protein
MKTAYLKFFTLTALILIFSIGIFAQTEREKGIEAYKKGNFAEAVRLLNQASKQAQYKNDGETWNTLGMAYINQSKTKDARKALEKAVKLTPQSSVYRANLAYAHLFDGKTDTAQSEIEKAIKIDAKNATAYFIRGTANLWESKNQRAVSDAELAISLDEKFTSAYVLHSDALLASFGDKWADDEKNPEDDLRLLTRASDSLSKCLASCPKDEALQIVSQRVDAIKAFTNYFERKKAGKTAPTADSAQNKIDLKITFKPKPRYTEDARANREQGDIRLAVFFGADGKTKYIMPLKGLRYGLTEETVRAARGMTFEPEQIDGKPVSVVKVVVFNYKIY